MRIAIVSDIHANLHAWRAVRDDLLRRNIDTVVCLGDIVGYGPNPAETLADVLDTCANIIMGNHDAAAAGLLDLDIFSDTARRSATWTSARLPDQARTSLAALPLTLEDGDILYAHADPAAPDQWAYIETKENARASLAAITARLTFIGHTHFPEIYTLAPDGTLTQTRPTPLKLQDGFRYLINVGSVGDPRDETQHASYVIFDTDEQRVEFHSIPFDVDSFAKAVAAAPELGTPWFLRHSAHPEVPGDREHAVRIIRAPAGKLRATRKATVRLSANQLRAATAAKLHTDRKPAPPASTQTTRKKRIWPTILISLLLVAGACTGIYLTNKPNQPPPTSAQPTITQTPSPQRSITHQPSPILLMASQARVTGALCLQTNSGITNLGCWMRGDYAVNWHLTNAIRTTYGVQLNYTTPNRVAAYAITAGTNRLTATAPATGGWHSYKTHKPGRITIDPGPTTLILKPINMKGPLMNIERITLTPAPSN